MNRDWIPSRIKAAIAGAYDGVCQHCGKAGAKEIDHIVPVTRGGGNDLVNLTLACTPCNIRKWANDLPEEEAALLVLRAIKLKTEILYRAGLGPPPPVPAQRGRHLEFPDKMLLRLPADTFLRIDALTGMPSKRGETLRRWILERLEAEERERARQEAAA